MWLTPRMGKGDFPQITPCEDRLFQKGIGLCVKPCAYQHPKNTPERIKTSFPERSKGGSRAVTQKPPADSEEQPSQDDASQQGGFYGELNQTQVFQHVSAYHGHEDRGEHELDNGHIHQPKGAELLVVANDPGLLKQKTEKDLCDETVKDHLHGRSQTSTANRFPAPP